MSSRSHVFLTVTVEQRHRDGDDPDHVRMKRGTLTIVDLAGSERVAKSGSLGLRLEEVGLGTGFDFLHFKKNEK